MNQTIFLILMIYTVTVDSYVLGMPLDFKREKQNAIALKNALKKVLKVDIKPLKKYINQDCLDSGLVFQTKDQRKIFVKSKCSKGADKLFLGEFEGLKAIYDTKTVPVPFPIATGETAFHLHNFIVMDYKNATSIDHEQSAELGRQLADMHMYNLQPHSKKPKIKQFGFHVETFCEGIPQNNTWTDDWITFFIENRIGYQLKLLKKDLNSVGETRTYLDYSTKKSIFELYWPRLKRIIPKFFEGIDVKPSLLHGELWEGNYAKSDSKPVVFNPAAFYGHHEYDVALSILFNDYFPSFLSKYFRKMPKAVGCGNRIKLYQLFFHFNYWNLYGEGFAEPTIKLIKQLLDMYY